MNTHTIELFVKYPKYNQGMELIIRDPKQVELINKH
jgi:hypothetical protein